MTKNKLDIKLDKYGYTSIDKNGERKTRIKNPIHDTPLDEMRFTAASFHPDAMPNGLGDSKRMRNLLAASSPGGIEQQEAEGQTSFVASTHMPIKINAGPRCGGEKVYTDMGIKVLGIDPNDQLFFNVVLPDGWQKKPTGHSMWNDLLDNLGRKRGSIFFKAAFYDYEAFFNQDCRFYIRVEPTDAYKSEISYEEREALPIIGRVYDGDTQIVFETVPAQRENAKTREERTAEYWDKQDEIKKSLQDQCEAWLIQNGYPDYKNPNAYWIMEIN
jgi:hypothetical protein